MDKLQQTIVEIDKIKNMCLLFAEGQVNILKGYKVEERTVQEPRGWFRSPVPKTTKYISELTLATTVKKFTHNEQGEMLAMLSVMKRARLRYLVMLRSFSELGYTLKPIQKISK